MNSQLVNIIFGMKVKQARLEAGLSLSEFAAQCDLSPSYVTEIEKGRKYPRADKIMRMAEVLHKRYDDLVSIRLEPPLTHLGEALSSPVLGQFPFEEFGIEMSDLVGALTRAPDKASALLHAIAEVGRQHDLKEQTFLWSALRSYQELHDNYFQDLEDAAAEFTQKYDLADQLPLSRAKLEELLHAEYGYAFDLESLVADPYLAPYYRSVLVRGLQPRLLLNARLHPYQLRFVLARELGYEFMKLKDRAYTSSPDQADSFQQVFNDFKAAYFAGAILMPRAQILEDIQAFFARETWTPQPLLDMLDKYEVTPETLMYRFSALVPQFFGLKLHYLRVHQRESGRYRLFKQLNLNRLRVPNGLDANEHFCRHWLVIRLLRELEAVQAQGKTHDIANPIVGVQLSEYIDTQGHFLCFGFARPLSLLQAGNSAGIIGFRVDTGLGNTIRFLNDPAIQPRLINETCERCGLTEAQCSLRAAAPRLLEVREKRRSRREALRQLMQEQRG